MRIFRCLVMTKARFNAASRLLELRFTPIVPASLSNENRRFINQWTEFAALNSSENRNSLVWNVRKPEFARLERPKTGIRSKLCGINVPQLTAGVVVAASCVPVGPSVWIDVSASAAGVVTAASSVPATAASDVAVNGVVVGLL